MRYFRSIVRILIEYKWLRKTYMDATTVLQDNYKIDSDWCKWDDGKQTAGLNTARLYTQQMCAVILFSAARPGGVGVIRTISVVLPTTQERIWQRHQSAFLTRTMEEEVRPLFANWISGVTRHGDPACAPRSYKLRRYALQIDIINDRYRNSMRLRIWKPSGFLASRVSFIRTARSFD